MYNNWDYPEGADCKDAPWNTKDDEEDVDIEEEKQLWNELYNDEK